MPNVHAERCAVLPLQNPPVCLKPSVSASVGGGSKQVMWNNCLLTAGFKGNAPGLGRLFLYKADCLLSCEVFFFLPRLDSITQAPGRVTAAVGGAALRKVCGCGGGGFSFRVRETKEEDAGKRADKGGERMKRGRARTTGSDSFHVSP